jgi:hypothetical protein
MSSPSNTQMPDRDQQLFQALIRALEENGLASRGDATAYLQADARLPMNIEESQSGKEPYAKTVNSLLQEIYEKQSLRRSCDRGRNVTSLDYGDSLRLEMSNGEKESDCRIQVSRCFRGRAWSFTVRRKVNIDERATTTLKQSLEALSENNLYKNGYKPPQEHVFKEGDLSLASIDEICDALLELFELDGAMDSHPSGLVLITGATDCGKSKIARGMIFKYLTSEGLKDTDRNRHLVTYEDPIEEWFFSGKLLEDERFKKNRRIDYTPREKGLDCIGFRECTRAALRQTPSVFFAGELRDPSDLAEAVYFGGTGHLIVATAHAGSVVEAADKILSAVEATNSFERAIEVPKIRGIVHLRRFKSEFEVEPTGKTAFELQTSMIVPSVYRRCQPGMQSFIADGLAALIPHCPFGDQKEYLRYGALGRQFLVRHTLRSRECTSREPICADALKAHPFWNHYWKEIRKFHAQWFAQDSPEVDIRPMSGKGAVGNPLWVQCVQDDLRGLR